MRRFALTWQDEQGHEWARVPLMAETPEEAAAMLVRTLNAGRSATPVRVWELTDDDPVAFIVRPTYDVEVVPR